MQFQFSFRQMETSKALQEYAQEKIQAQIEKFVTKAIEVQITFSVDKHLQQVFCSFVGGDGFSLNVEHSCEDMYGSIDRVVDKLATQLKRKKDKLKQHKFKDSIKTLPIGTGLAEPEEDFALDATDIIKYEEARRKRAF